MTRWGKPIKNKGKKKDPRYFLNETLSKPWEEPEDDESREMRMKAQHGLGDPPPVGSGSGPEEAELESTLREMEALMAECEANPGGEACMELESMAADKSLKERKLQNRNRNTKFGNKQLLNEVLLETGLILTIGKLIIKFGLLYGMHHVYRGVDWAWEKAFGTKPLLGKGLTGMPVIDNYGFAQKILAWIWGEKEKTPKEKRLEKLKTLKQSLEAKLSQPPEDGQPPDEETIAPADDAAPKYDWDTRDSHRRQEYSIKDPLMERWNRIIK